MSKFPVTEAVEFQDPVDGLELTPLASIPEIAEFIGLLGFGVKPVRFSAVDAFKKWGQIAGNSTNLAGAPPAGDNEEKYFFLTEQDGPNAPGVYQSDGASWTLILEVGSGSGGAFFSSSIPAGPGESGQINFVVSGDFEGFLYAHDGSSWSYQTQYKVPVFTVEPEPSLQRVIDIANELPSGEFYVDYASSGTLSRYRIFSNGIVEGPMTGGSGGAILPANAVGYLRNDGSGNLSWQDSNRQYTHNQPTPSAVWNVNHNLNSQIDSVNIYVGGQLVGADVSIVDTNNLTITFASPEVGVAIIET